MIKIMYTRSHLDHCVWFKNLKKNGYFNYLILYVDDMLITLKSKVEIKELKA